VGTTLAATSFILGNIQGMATCNIGKNASIHGTKKTNEVAHDQETTSQDQQIHKHLDTQRDICQN
jgi:hypothetical protein